jgi:hypothetical protein
VERAEGSPRPFGAAALAAAAAALATLFGTSPGEDLPTAAQVVGAVVIAAAALAVVPAAARTTRTRVHLVVVTAGLLSAGAAAIHFAVIGGHFEEWWGFGVFFVLSGVAQLVWSLLAATRPTRPLFWLGVLGNMLIVGLWVLTRTAGTVVGPEPSQPEPVGLADSIATGFEVALVAGAFLVARRGIPRWTVLRVVAWAAGAIVLALTAVALLSAIGAAPGVVPPTE